MLGLWEAARSKPVRYPDLMSARFNVGARWEQRNPRLRFLEFQSIQGENEGLFLTV